jgi:chromosome segregation ATPase
MPDRFDEILLEMRREHDEWMARMDRRLDQTDDNLRFLGELNRRSEIVFQDLLRGNRAMRAEIRASIAETRQSIAESKRRTAEINARIEANTAESKAHTRTIFALIDRLEGGSGPLAPAT